MKKLTFLEQTKLPETLKVSVIIAVKNDAENLRQCLECLSMQTYKLFEVIVIDNNSTPDQSEIIQRHCYKYRAVYDFEPIPGAYAARNLGLTLSAGDLIAFTDADCRPWQSWISGAVLAFESYEFDAVAGHINFTFSASPPPIAELIDSFTHLQQEHYADLGYGAGANLWVRRECFEIVGPFRSEMLRLGDREWGQRAFNYGVHVTYCPLTTVNHPARNWSALIGKLWAQLEWKHYLKPFTWRDILPSAIVPWTNYKGAIRDPLLPGFNKIRFLLALHFIGILQAVRIAQMVIVNNAGSARG